MPLPRKPSQSRKLLALRRCGVSCPKASGIDMDELVSRVSRIVVDVLAEIEREDDMPDGPSILHQYGPAQ